MQSLNQFPSSRQKHTDKPPQKNFLNCFQEFSSNYKLEDVKIIMKGLQDVSLTTDNTTFNTGQKRGNLIHFHDSVIDLLVAVFSHMGNTKKPLKKN